MKHKPFFNIFLAVSMLGVSMLACLSANPKPPNYGVFFQQNGEWVELQEQEIFSIPVEREMSNSRAISDSQPSVVIWRTETNLDYLELYKLSQYLGQSKRVSYDATPMDNGIIKITPDSPLEDGIYCLIQGDPLAVILSGWCFRVEAGLTDNIPASEFVSAETAVLPNTLAPQIGLKKEWTIKTGELKNIGVASNGTIYAVGNKLYAIISSDGDTLQTNKMDIGDCLRDPGGYGEIYTNNWFILKSDGTIFANAKSGVSCEISPADPPEVKKEYDTGFFPYSTNLLFHEWPLPPEEFENAKVSVDYIGDVRRDKYTFYISKITKRAAYINHNGDLQYFNLPEDLDMESRLHELKVVITPWDDIYYTYPAYDQLGNNMGDKIMKVDRNTNETDQIYVLPKPFFEGKFPTYFLYNIIYLSEKQEVYILEYSSASQQNELVLYNLDLKRIRAYPLPSDFPSVTYGRTDSTNKLFVGYDGNIYVFDTEFSNSRTLTKYSLPSNVTQSQQTSTAENNSTATFEVSSASTIIPASTEAPFAEVSVEVIDTSKGDFLQIQSDGNEYEIGPLEKGTYTIGPNKKFIIYCTNSGSVYAARIGDSNLARIGDIEDFSIILRGEAPKLEFEFLGDHPYSVVIYEQILKQSKILEIPRYITSPN